MSLDSEGFCQASLLHLAQKAWCHQEAAGSSKCRGGPVFHPHTWHRLALLKIPLWVLQPWPLSGPSDLHKLLPNSPSTEATVESGGALTLAGTHPPSSHCSLCKSHPWASLPATAFPAPRGVRPKGTPAPASRLYSPWKQIARSLLLLETQH